MGKTHRSVIRISRSISVSENKHRGFARKNDRTSHHRVRSANKNADEMSIVKVEKTVRFPDIALPLNIPNLNKVPTGDCFYPFIEYYGHKFDYTMSDEENIRQCFNNGEIMHSFEKKYFKDTLKQFERRNKASCFRGHNKARDFKMFENEF